MTSLELERPSVFHHDECSSRLFRELYCLGGTAVSREGMPSSTPAFLWHEYKVDRQARRDKSERLKTLGYPIELSGKALAFEVKGNYAWIGESTATVKKLDLEVRRCWHLTIVLFWRFLIIVQTGKVLQVYTGHTGPVTAIAFCDRVAGSGDQQLLISGSWDQVRHHGGLNKSYLLNSALLLAEHQNLGHKSA